MAKPCASLSGKPSDCDCGSLAHQLAAKLFKIQGQVRFGATKETVSKIRNDLIALANQLMKM